MDDYRRKERKKELAKNKAKRLAARDAKILTERRGLKEVEKEIHKWKQQLQQTVGGSSSKQQKHIIQRQLDQLQKEYKLLQSSAAADAASKITPPTNIKKTPKVYENAKYSIYYDPIMNPHGVPPPGKPMLYHSDENGGITKFIEQAIIPLKYRTKEDDENDKKRKENATLSGIQSSSQNNMNDTTSQKDDSHSHDNTFQKQNRTSLEKNKMDHSSSHSSIPLSSEPSKDVIRTSSSAQQPPRKKKKKRHFFKKGTDDIWANDDEEKKINSFNNGIYYKDNQGGNIQGPFPIEQIKHWIQSNMFLQSTPFSKDGGISFQPLKQLYTSYFFPPPPPPPPPRENTDLDARIAGLRNSKTNLPPAPPPPPKENSQDIALEARILALRGSNANHIPPPPIEESEDTNLEARIAALRNSNSNPPPPPPPPPPPIEEVEDSALEARIAALRKPNNNNPPSPPTPVPIENSENSALEARIAALRNSNNNPPPLPPSSIEDSDREIQIPAYPIDENEEDQVPAYPIDQNEEYEVPAYTVDDNIDGEVPAYHVNDDTNGEIPAYPIDDDTNDEISAYPVDDNIDGEIPAYPIDEENAPMYNGQYMYPIDNSYPNTDDAYVTTFENDAKNENSNEMTHQEEEISNKPKSYKADSDVVGLLPTRFIQRKKTIATKKKQKTSQLSSFDLSNTNTIHSTSTVTQNYDTVSSKHKNSGTVIKESTADEYDDFFNEIEKSMN